MEKERGHATWTCIDAGPKNADGTGNAKIIVAAAPGMQHNKVTKLTPDVVFVDVGAPKKDGRVNVELLGFVASLLGLEESQVKLESGAGEKERNKVLSLSGLTQGKRELIWMLQGKVGERHEPHFSVDKINAERRLKNEGALKRKRELDEFQALREEAHSASHKIGEVAALAGKAGAHTTSALPSALRVKRKGQEGDCESEGAARVAPPQPAADGSAGVAVSTMPASDAAAGSPAKEGATVVPTEGARSPLGGRAALAAYDSEDSEDEDERPTLPQPFL